MLLIYGTLLLADIETIFVRLIKSRHDKFLIKVIPLTKAESINNSQLIFEVCKHRAVKFAQQLFALMSAIYQYLPSWFYLLLTVNKNFTNKLLTNMRHMNVSDAFYRIFAFLLIQKFNKRLPITMSFYHSEEFIWAGKAVAPYFKNVKKVFVFDHLHGRNLIIFYESLVPIYAKHLGTNHTEIYVDDQDALNLALNLLSTDNEASADRSQIPKFPIVAEARMHVKAALSGDELVGGRTRFTHSIQLASKLEHKLQPCFPLFNTLKALLIAEIWLDIEKVAGLNASLHIFNRLKQVSELAAMVYFKGVYQQMVFSCKQPKLLLLGGCSRVKSHEFNQIESNINRFARLMFTDSVTCLPDNILVKVEGAAVAALLQTRALILDHRFIELAMTLHARGSFDSDVGKRPLKQVLHKSAPKALLDRPKTSFGMLTDYWLRRPLRDWTEQLLDSSKLTQRGIFNVVQVRNHWHQDLSDNKNWQYLFWIVLNGVNRLLVHRRTEDDIAEAMLQVVNLT